MKLFKPFVAMVAAGLVVAATPAYADILVSPTRVVMEPGERTAELVFLNKSDEESAFRISIENRRMLPDGSMEKAEEALPGELFAKDFLRYSPRRVVLGGGEQQVLRISSRIPADLPPGEYRSHLRIMAVPVSAGNTLQSLASEDGSDTLSITLVAIQSVTIPIIVRVGKLDASVEIEALSLEQGEEETESFLVASMSRDGTRSTYGDIQIFADGERDPVYFARGIAVYVPNDQRDVILPLPEEVKQKIAGRDVRIVYASSDPENPGILAEHKTRLP
jgi:hypothetical protein